MSSTAVPRAPTAATSPSSSSLYNVTTLLIASAILRLVMLVYGLYQDATSPFKYTDIDYFVFTDAARFVAHHGSPYDRATYRYTPLLAWLLLPTTKFFSFGKVLFALGDVVAGYLIIRILRGYGLSEKRAIKYSMIWLLNPMVATISTRGSSEGLLGAMVVALLWAVERRRVVLSGLLLGLSVHFKIYPFIYAPAIIWWMEKGGASNNIGNSKTFMGKIVGFVTYDRAVISAVSLGTFMALNGIMYAIYGFPFVQHTFLHHISRVDHRHNFSPYNMLLYLSSAPNSSSTFPFKIESLAFLPQLLLSAIAIPIAFAKQDLPTTMFAQTFAFVTFNKVCTSQYFMWYLVLLPFYLPKSSMLADRKVAGVVALLLWVGGQALWLQQGYLLEFLGQSTFFPGLWLSSLLFFVVNIWILGIVIGDIRDTRGSISSKIKTQKQL